MKKGKLVPFLAGAFAFALGNVHAATPIQAETYTSRDALGTVNQTVGGAVVENFGAGPNTFIEWNNITVSDAGEYKLTFRYANGNTTNQAVKCQVKVNDGSTVNSSATATIIWPYTGSWSTFSTISYIVRLNSGTNKIRLTASTWEGPNVDHMTIYAAKSKVFSGTINTEGRAVPGTQWGDYGDIGVPENILPENIRGYECYVAYHDGNYGSGEKCRSDYAEGSEVRHYYDNPINYWIIVQPDAIGRNYSLEVNYWE